MKWLALVQFSAGQYDFYENNSLSDYLRLFVFHSFRLGIFMNETDVFITLWPTSGHISRIRQFTFRYVVAEQWSSIQEVHISI